MTTVKSPHFLETLRFLEYEARALLTVTKITKELATSIFRVQAIQEHSY